MWISRLKRVRRMIMVLGVANLAVVVFGAVLALVSSSDCGLRHLFPVFAVCFAACFKIAAMVKMAFAQELMAKTIMDSQTENSHERRLRYKTWLWWTRLAMVINVLQIIGATYLMFHVAKFVSHDGMPKNCILGLTPESSWWKKRLLVAFMVIVCSVGLVQCFTGSDVLQWRSFYATQDDAWKAHYQEVFDHGIREVLCCLGRGEYMSAMEEDEVYSVARLLGDLVAYQASGTGHLELLAGLALLQRNSQFPKSHEGFKEAPMQLLQDAASFHKFAEAAYTGLLLDIGRNPVLFLCTWICRQGILTPWSRKWRPKLDGDNWWRGHAAAFLKFINCPPHVLRRGCICREKCKATYFVVVLHYLRCVVIAVRGTETPEDLITDGLGGACPLSAEDLDGIIDGDHIHNTMNQSMDPSFTHYGHSGIVEATRDLFMQIEGHCSYGEDGSTGFLSSLLGNGCECEGYSIRVVGHSLGGAIAALLGIRLHGRFPDLHVYAFGPLPCVDIGVAEACSEFVTSIVLNNEFSARLSVGSILRLRAAAITAVAQDTEADTALIFRLARRFLYVSNWQRSNIEATFSGRASAVPSKESIHHLFQENVKQDQVCPLCDEPNSQQNAVEIQEDNEDNEFINPFHDMAADAAARALDDPVSQFMDTVPHSENTSAGDPPDMFLPGLLIHIVPQRDNIHTPIWRAWGICDLSDDYKAYIVNRESFKDIVVSQSMFLDHLPWRCRHAILKVLESRNIQDLVSESPMV